MTQCQRIRGAGAVIALAQGGLSLKKATPAVIGYAKTHKAEILAELAREQASPVFRLSSALRSMRDELDRIYSAGADRPKCMKLLDCIDSVLVEEDDPKEFFAVIRRIGTSVLDLVMDIEGNRVLEGTELSKVTSKVFADKPKPAASKVKINSGAFA